MQKKIFALFVAFIIFSFQVFSQTTKESDHPLLDKYYPRKQADTSSAQIKPTPKPVVTSIPIVSKPVPISKPVNIIPPVVIAPAPVVADTTTAVVKPVPVTETKPVTAPGTIAVNMPAPVPIPVQKIVVNQPPSKPYIDTRLGSSTPQYDTWKKNNNGAGSVTTSPK